MSRLAILLALAGLPTPAFTQHPADAEVIRRLAEDAEARGERREALRQYALYRRVAGWADTRVLEDSALQRKIFMLAAALDPPPALPDSARVYEIRAEAAFDMASRKDDFIRAGDEYAKAIAHAPWIPRFYFNLALMHEKAGNIRKAAATLKIYLRAPDIEDRDEVLRKVVSLDFAREKAENDRTTDSARYAAIDRWLGTWGYYFKYKPRGNKLTAIRCTIIRSDCGQWSKRVADVDTASVVSIDGAWKKLGTVELKRIADTLFVEGRVMIFRGIIAPDLRSIQWHKFNRDPEWAACSGYEESGFYKVNWAVVRPRPGDQEFHFTSPTKWTMFGECSVWPPPEYGIALARGPQPQTIKAGDEVRGALTINDATRACVRSCLAGGQYYHAWLFDGQVGDKIEIEMTSADFDAEIVLLWLDADGNWAWVDQDDNGGEEKNARLRTKLRWSGNYAILASSNKAGEAGEYVLSFVVTETGGNTAGKDRESSERKGKRK